MLKLYTWLSVVGIALMTGIVSPVRAQTARPDLVAVNVDVGAGIEIWIKNQGTANAVNLGDKFYTKIEWLDNADQVLDETFAVLPAPNIISPGSMYRMDDSATYGHGQPQSAVKLRVIVDVHGRVTESNEDNNTLVKDVEPRPTPIPPTPTPTPRTFSIGGRSSPLPTAAPTPTPVPPTTFPDLIVQSADVAGVPEIFVKNQGDRGVMSGDKFTTRIEWLSHDGAVIKSGTMYLVSTYMMRPGETYRLDDSNAMQNQQPQGAVRARITVDANNLVAESDETNNTMNIDTVLASATPMATPLSPTPNSSPGQNLTYPIAELGNCGSADACREYCDQNQNIPRCLDFAERHDMMSREEVRKARKVTKETDGPGDCHNRGSCQTFCDKLGNIKQCLEYAEQNELMTDEEVEKAENVVEAFDKKKTKTPGDCQSPDQCETYCDAPEHADECVKFGEETELLTDEEVQEAETFLKMVEEQQTPGNCQTIEECEKYCESQDHWEECASTFEIAGIGVAEEAEQPEMPEEEPVEAEPEVMETEDQVQKEETADIEYVEAIESEPTETEVEVESLEVDESPMVDEDKATEPDEKTSEPEVQGISTSRSVFDMVREWLLGQ